MNWFWNQWYYGSGHPKLNISYNYNLAGMPGVAEVIVKQTQTTGKTFTIPLTVDVYINGSKERYNVVADDISDTFYFKAATVPELINVDADKILLTEKTDNKTEANYIAQWKYGKTYQDRREAIDFFAKKNMPEIGKGLTDKYAGIRSFTIQKLAATPYKTDKVVLEEIEKIAKSDNNKKLRAAAINFLVKTTDNKYLPIYQAAVNDSSYSVAGAGLKGLAQADPSNAYDLAKKYSSDAKGPLSNEIKGVLYTKGSDSDFDFLLTSYKAEDLSFEKISGTDKLAMYLIKLTDVQKIKSGVDAIMQFRNAIPAAYRGQTDPLMKASLDKISKEKTGEVADYINSVWK